MHVKIITVAFLMFVCCFSYSQSFDENNFQKNIKVFDTEGKPFANPAIDVEGTQFYFKNWKYGTIKLINAIYNNVSVKMNLQSQEVHYLDAGKIEMAVSPNLVKELIIYDTADGVITKYDFQCGYPAFEKQTEKDFYLVLSNGKVTLLESIKKEIKEEKDDVFGESKKVFVTNENYYLDINNNMQFIKLNKTSILEALHDQQGKIEAFVKANNLSYKKQMDVKKIIDYYNTL